jgi:beta-N-acetylhexosaminidase
MSDLEFAAARMFCCGFDTLAIPREMRMLIGRGISGAVLFKRNISSPLQVADLCARLKALSPRPFLTSVDQEGGRVMRLGPPFSQVPSMRTVGQTNDPHLARDIGTLLGRELRAVNIDMDFAPVLDVDTNPANPVIGTRSFGASPALVSEMGCALIDGLQSAGVAACAKHFPGHGDTTQDSHLDLPRLPHHLDRLNGVELVPFVAAARANVAAIMTAHVIFEAIDPVYPATMSAPVLTGILRNQLNYDGVIISDDLEMKAIANHYSLEEVIIHGVNAGIDLFAICYTPSVQHEAIDLLIKAVERGDVARATLDRSARRFDALASRFIRPAAVSPSLDILGCREHQRWIESITSSPSDDGAIDPTDYQPRATH